ncbi:MAG: aminotransferase class I/II-fold pyridoxal phosphate-dependent enzyme [Acidimicrobiales bacterium]
MDFRRINGLPPYVFAHIDALKLEARRAGRDVVDLGFGNPDIPSPDIAVEKLAEAVRNPRNHRYSASRGIPKLRQAISALYMRRFGVEIDPDREAVVTIGAKEGLSHLMWVLVGPGDSALVPSPSYPIHIYAPLFAGAEVRQVRLEDPGRPEGGSAEAFFDNLIESWESAWPKPRVIVLSFPHNPTTSCVDLQWMTRIVEFAREHDVVLVHDFAYADISYDGYKPPSILEVPGAKECSVELYTLTKSFSMAGWRVGFLVGNAEIVQDLTKLKSYLDYGTFQPIQIAAIVAMNEASDYPKVVNDIYQARRDALCDGLNRIGWQVARPKGTMFVWAPIPEPYREMGSLEFSSFLVSQAEVATSPGVGFGPGGDGHVRFALIENEQRIGQAIRNLRRGLTKL